MTDPATNTEHPQPAPDSKVGKAPGGGDSSGAGNILGGVQPDQEDGDGRERRETKNSE